MHHNLQRYRPLRIILLLGIWLFVSFIPPRPLDASDPALESRSIGPSGGSVSTIAFAPNYQDNRHIFAAAGASVFKSTDGAASWVFVGAIPFPSRASLQPRVHKLAVSPNFSADQTLIAATTGGLYRSADGGQSWSLVSAAVEFRTVGISPGFAQDGLALAGGFQTGLLRSTDGGATWRRDGAGLSGRDHFILDVAFSPAYATDTLILVGANTAGLLRSSDGGNSWSVLGNATQTSASLIAFSPDYARDRTIFVAGGSGGPIRSTDGGATWRVINDNGQAYVFDLYISPNYAEDKTLLGAAQAASSLARSTDGGGSWSQLDFSLGSLNSDYYGMLAFSPSYASDRLILAAPGDARGVFASRDVGASWSPAVDGLAAQEIGNIAFGPGSTETMFAASSNGLYRSLDAGATWLQVQSASPLFGPGHVTVSPGFAADATVFYSNLGLSRSRDGGATWVGLNLFRPASPSVALTIAGAVTSYALSPGFASDQTLFAYYSDYIGNESALYRSTNAGDSWRRLGPGPASGVAALLLPPDYPASRVVYAAAGDGIYRSTNDGATFTRVYALAPGNNPYASRLTASPAYAQDGTVFAAVGGQLLRTTDRGASWAPLRSLAAAATLVLAPDYADNRTVYLAELSAPNSVIYRSRDGGTSWEVYYTLSGVQATSLAIAPYAPTTLFLGTAATSIFTVRPAAVLCTILQDSIQSAVAATVDNGERSLRQILDSARQVAADGDYFATELEAGKAELVAELVVDVVGVASAGFGSQAEQIKGELKKALPGVAGRGWGRILTLRESSEQAARAFNLALQQPATAANARFVAKTFFSGPGTYYAASLADSELETLVGDLAVQQQIAQALARGPQPFQQSYLPIIQETHSLYTNDTAQAGAQYTQAPPCLDLATQAAYAEDLRLRRTANAVIANFYRSQAAPLHLARSAREGQSDSWLIGFLERNLLRFIFVVSIPGPFGAVLFEAGNLIWNLAENVRRLDEADQMVTMTEPLMQAAKRRQDLIYLNAAHGIDYARLELPVETAQVELGEPMHKSVGEYKLFGKQWWWEGESFVEVPLVNQTGFQTSVEALTTYEKKTLFDLDFQALSSVGTLELAGGASGAVIVPLYRNQQGESPNDGDAISISVVGSTQSGTYFVGTVNDRWAPTRVRRDGTPATLIGPANSEAVPTLPYPLRSTLGLAPGSLSHRGRLLVINPFPDPINVVVTQGLPAGASVLDSGGGILENQGTLLRWIELIPAQTTLELSYLVSLGGPPGSTQVVPGATLTMTSADGAARADFAAEPASVTLPMPLEAIGAGPGALSTNAQASLMVRLTNRATTTASGTIRLQILTQEGAVAREAGSTVQLEAGATTMLNLPFVAPGTPGLYNVSVRLEDGGASDEFLAYQLQVVANRYYLPFMRR